MAIRRVTGAVSPSELIFADANALGATYDGSGTTIERGETFTLPAGGTTAVSNGALRLEALKGDCTITNNGNSTLTNASGVDGTIVMRSGASDFPAFVRNSSMGSMEVPAREDFTGVGTFSGAVSSTATVPATISACEKLYANEVSGVSSISVDGYFDDTKYGFYQMHIKNVRISSSETNKEFALRANLGGSTSERDMHWTASGGNHNNNGNAGSFDRADNDGGSFAYMDNTWSMVNSGQPSRNASYTLQFSDIQSSRHKIIHSSSYGNGHQNEANYDAWVGTRCIAIVTNEPLTGLTFFIYGSSATILQAEILLVGFRK